MNNIGLNLSQRAALSPNLEAYVEPESGTRLTYQELNDYANRCAGVLAGLGLVSGDRIALLLQNSVEFVGLFYGAAKLGLVVVPLNTRLAPLELAFILSDSGARALVFGSGFADAIGEVRSNKQHELTVEHYLTTGLASESAHSLSSLFKEASSAEPRCAHGDQDNLFIMYTSGTTGLPKGVVHTHETISWSGMAWTATMDVRYEDRMLLPLPMFHVAALTAVIMCAMRGITIISQPSFDPLVAWQLIRDESVTIGGAVPAILNFMRQAPDFDSFDSSQLRCFITGGAPMPKALIELYNARGMQVVQGYALTESGGSGSFLMNEHALSRAGSAGRSTMFGQLAVRDESGDIHDRGTGEVLIKAPYLLKEYWNRPEATAESFVDGWFRTGDIAEIDADGYLYIKDRIKDMIISGGENIYPAEIENAIIAHPAVAEVAVIGLPDEKWGEIPCAVVVADRNEVNEEAIVAWCGERLSRYKLPKKVIYIDVLPRNPSGKVLKRTLKERYA